MSAYKCLKGRCPEDGARLFPVVPSDRMTGNSHKLKQKKFQLYTRKNFCTLRVAEHWNRLPREAVKSPSPDTFQTHLDMFLCRLFQVTLPCQGVRLDDLQRSIPTLAVQGFCDRQDCHMPSPSSLGVHPAASEEWNQVTCETAQAQSGEAEATRTTSAALAHW